ncbi:MAG TPA: hypothetical protein P5513_02835 [Candidatus Diapherotrites archaeon]|nr:hypothetical protein [Candidatus Diapherotrites archaeon]
MKILLISNIKFLDKLPTIKFNIKKHNAVLPTFQLGKISKYLNKKSIFLKKDMDLLKECDALLVANFKNGRINNYIGPSCLMLMGVAYSLDKKIYLLYDIPNSKYKEEILALEPICLKGDLKNLR